MGMPLHYEEQDFTVKTGADTGDRRISHVIDSNDGVVHANLFWLPGNVYMRGLVGETGTFELGFPFAYPSKYDPRQTLPNSDVVRCVMRTLARGEYND
jgi:hypothetical protein